MIVTCVCGHVIPATAVELGLSGQNLHCSNCQRVLTPLQVREREQAARAGPPLRPGFGGSTHDPERDGRRLKSQTARVFRLMRDQSWRTLEEIGTALGDPPASVSARLRDLRKIRFGAHTVERRHRAGSGPGLFEYRLTANETTAPALLAALSKED